jgi:colanic acid/amylovoran biosynthesis glycosyltransferase
MTTVAYIANQFPSPLEPYVMDQVDALRERGVRVVCCSGKRVPPGGLDQRERRFWSETHFFQPLTDAQLVRSLSRLRRERVTSAALLRPVLKDFVASPAPRTRSLGHTLMGAALAEKLAPMGVQHIHAHHGYFASWMALVAARLMNIGFSLTLHGSDLLVRADLLQTKLQECRFCVTVSDFNRDYILRKYPSVPPDKVLVQRLGVDAVKPRPVSAFKAGPHRFCLLSVGRLHVVKNYKFLIDACAELRNAGLDFICWIAGDGPERAALERHIDDLQLRGRVLLLGHVAHADLSSYYSHADLITLTSVSEGLPVALMEAMAHEKLVIAPAITGIPELVEHGRNGFLYQAGKLRDFVSSVRWILESRTALREVERAAAKHVSTHFDRRHNVDQFANHFLQRITQPEPEYASSLLQ